MTRRGGIERALFVYAPLAFALLFLLGPFYWMVITSLKPNSELYNAERSPLYVATPTLEHFVFLFTKTAFLEWTKNTMIVATGATAVALLLGVPAGYALARFRFRGGRSGGHRRRRDLPRADEPPVHPDGPGHEHHRARRQLLGAGGRLPDLPGALRGLADGGLLPHDPGELEECARIDGASRLGALWRIAIPLARPGIVSAGIFAFTLSWNEFIYALTLVTASSERTIPVGVLVQLTRADFYFWGPLMAGALAGSVPVALIYSFFVDQYAAGLTAGAVKG